MVSDFNARFVDILENELERLRTAKGDQVFPRSLKEVASFLGINVTVFSKYRRGERLVTPRVARQIAAKLRGDERGGTEAERSDLYSKLLSAVPQNYDGDTEAKKWINDRGAPGNLLLAEFRDLPAGRPFGPHEDLARDAGRAVANGLSYGLFWPFAVPSLGDSQVPFPIRIYLAEIWNGVQGAFRRILAGAFEAESLETPDAPKDALRENLHAITHRLRVYVLGGDLGVGANPCPGLGYKLFFVRDKDRPPELQQWFSTDAGEKIVQKRTNENELAAVESRFYPIPECFIESEPAHLPDNDEIQARADYDSADAPLGGAALSSRWICHEVISRDALDRMIERVIADR
jgi:transcriptional regulator with XRE-family HTH domain